MDTLIQNIGKLKTILEDQQKQKGNDMKLLIDKADKILGKLYELDGKPLELLEKPLEIVDENRKGITNGGNDCFLNAAIQFLYSIDELRTFFCSEIDYDELITKGKCNNIFLIIALETIFKLLAKNDKEITLRNETINENQTNTIEKSCKQDYYKKLKENKINPIPTIYQLLFFSGFFIERRNVDINNKDQQDSQEFLSKILDGLDDLKLIDFLRYKTYEKLGLVSLEKGDNVTFNGNMRGTINDDVTSIIYNDENDVQQVMPIENVKKTIILNDKSQLKDRPIEFTEELKTASVNSPFQLVFSFPPPEPSEIFNIKDLIKETTKFEFFDEIQYAYDREKLPLLKKNYVKPIDNYPTYFMFHAKRFADINTKINNEIIPEKLIKVGKFKYILKGFIIHWGGNANSGHYVYVSYNSDGDVTLPTPYTVYDDSDVLKGIDYEKSEKKFVNNGYVYLYKRIDVCEEIATVFNSGIYSIFNAVLHFLYSIDEFKDKFDEIKSLDDLGVDKLDKDSNESITMEQIYNIFKENGSVDILYKYFNDLLKEKDNNEDLKDSLPNNITIDILFNYITHGLSVVKPFETFTNNIYNYVNNGETIYQDEIDNIIDDNFIGEYELQNFTYIVLYKDKSNNNDKLTINTELFHPKCSLTITGCIIHKDGEYSFIKFNDGEPLYVITNNKCIPYNNEDHDFELYGSLFLYEIFHFYESESLGKDNASHLTNEGALKEDLELLASQKSLEKINSHIDRKVVEIIKNIQPIANDGNHETLINNILQDAEEKIKKIEEYNFDEDAIITKFRTNYPNIRIDNTLLRLYLNYITTFDNENIDDIDIEILKGYEINNDDNTIVFLDLVDFLIENYPYSITYFANELKEKYNARIECCNLYGKLNYFIKEVHEDPSIPGEDFWTTTNIDGITYYRFDPEIPINNIMAILNVLITNNKNLRSNNTLKEISELYISIFNDNTLLKTGNNSRICLLVEKYSPAMSGISKNNFVPMEN